MKARKCITERISKVMSRTIAMSARGDGARIYDDSAGISMTSGEIAGNVTVFTRELRGLLKLNVMV